MKKTLVLLLLLFITISTAFSQQGVDTLSLESIFYEPLLAGNRPGLVRFSPDQQTIYYQGNDSAMMDNELFRVDLSGANREEAPEDFERGYNLSPDGKQLAYVDEGDIWLADPSFENSRKIVNSSEREYNIVWSPDSKRLAFVQNGDAWIIDINQAGFTQVTNKKQDEPGYSVSGWAGNDKLVMRQFDNSDNREYYFPEYVNQYVQTGSTRRGIARQIVSVAHLDSIHVELVFEGKGYVNASASVNGQYLALDHIDADQKNRIIEVYDLAAGDSAVVFENSTDGWLYGTDMEFAPEGNSLMIQSEKDGWNHIYTVQPNGSDLTQHTEGEFEVPWGEWLNSNEIIFASTQTDPGERHIYRLNIDDGTINKLTAKEGYRKSFRLSENKQHLVYDYTFFNEPFELYALNLNNPDQEVRLTQTIPERFNQIGWQKEDYIRFTGRDGNIHVGIGTA